MKLFVSPLVMRTFDGKSLKIMFWSQRLIYRYGKWIIGACVLLYVLKICSTQNAVKEIPENIEIREDLDAKVTLKNTQAAATEITTKKHEEGERITTLQSTINEYDKCKNMSFAELPEDINSPIWYEMMENRFYCRQAFIKQQCKKYKPSAKDKLKHRMYLYSPKYNLMACTITKAGSTSLKAYMSEINGYKDLPPVRYDMYLRQGKLPKDGLSRFTPSAVSLVSVRHPFNRLVSAYKDKFKDGKELPNNENLPQFRQMWSRVIDTVGKTMGNSTEIMFPEFIKHVITFHTSTMDSHWQLQNEMCAVCDHPFKYIVRLETFAEDIAYVARKHAIKEMESNIRKNARTRKKDQITQGELHYPTYYSQLSDTMLLDLYLVFKLDFALFGYEVPDYLQKILPPEELEELKLCS